MAKEAITKYAISIRLACLCLGISESCFYYQSKLNAENEQIADWLLRLTDNKKCWGFGLCFLYLRNVKGFKWNHKRVYRIYRELELNLRHNGFGRITTNAPTLLSEEYHQGNYYRLFKFYK